MPYASSVYTSPKVDQTPLFSFGPQPLPSRQTVPFAGAKATPTVPNESGNLAPAGMDWGGVAGAAAPLIASLFGSNPAAGQAKDVTNELLNTSRKVGARGDRQYGQGEAALIPVLAYLHKMAGGNPADLLAAVQPQVARVLDQYDTAKQTAVRNSPRGGGQVSSLFEMEGHKASDIATTIASAHREAINSLGNLGMNLEQNAPTGIEGMSAALQGLLAQSQQRGQSNAGFGSALGGILAKTLPLFL
jgi:hypothetical protein